MSIEEPKISDTAKVPIGKAAELLEISRNTLRRHTDNGYIRCGYNRVNKRRFYTGAEIKRYWRAHA